MFSSFRRLIDVALWRANIYKSVIINSSKEMMSFSDFPPPADLPNNMHHSEVLLYLRLYAQTFNLLPHIRFQVGDLHKEEKTKIIVSALLHRRNDVLLMSCR